MNIPAGTSFMAFGKSCVVLLSNRVSKASSIEEIAEMINDGGTCEGMEGIEFTSEQLAGQYAYQAIEESDYPNVTENALFNHAEFLVEAGAKFDMRKAVEWGMRIAKEYDKE